MLIPTTMKTLRSGIRFKKYYYLLSNGFDYSNNNIFNTQDKKQIVV